MIPYLKKEYRVEFLFADGCAAIIASGTKFLVDVEDLPMLLDYRWYRSNPKRPYAIAKQHNKQPLLMHRLLMNAPHGFVVDHVNGNPLDNRKSNLRLCTQEENAKNRKTQYNSNGFRGVHKNGSGYIATISVNRKFHYLGRFKSAELASAAYQEAANRLHGKFVRR